MRYEQAREALDEEAELLNEKRRGLQRKHQAEIDKQRATRDADAKDSKEQHNACQATTD